MRDNTWRYGSNRFAQDKLASQEALWQLHSLNTAAPGPGGEGAEACPQQYAKSEHAAEDAGLSLVVGWSHRFD